MVNKIKFVIISTLVVLISSIGYRVATVNVDTFLNRIWLTILV